MNIYYASNINNKLSHKHKRNICRDINSKVKSKNEPVSKLEYTNIWVVYSKKSRKKFSNYS